MQTATENVALSDQAQTQTLGYLGVCDQEQGRLSRLGPVRGFQPRARGMARKGMPPADVPALGRSHLTESVHNVVLQKSIPAQIRQRILHMGNRKGYIDGFVRESTYAKRLDKHFL